MKSEQKRLLVISLVVVLGVFFFAFGEEMAAITLGNSTGYVSAGKYENITVLYELPGYTGSQGCDLTLSYFLKSAGRDTEVIVGSVYHSNSQNSMTGRFPVFYVTEPGEYELEMEISYRQGPMMWKNAVLKINGVQGETPQPGNGSSGNGSGNNSGTGNGTGGSGNGGQPVVIGNGETGFIEIIPGGSNSGGGSQNQSNDGNNSNNSNAEQGGDGEEKKTKHGLEYNPPKSMKEALENFIDFFWRLLTGEISLMDILKALIDAIIDIINGDFDFDAFLKVIFYALILIIVLVVAVLGVYLILKLVILKYMTKRRNN